MLDIHVKGKEVRVAVQGSQEEVFKDVAFALLSIYNSLNSVHKPRLRFFLMVVAGDESFWRASASDHTQIRGPLADKLLHKIFEQQKGE